MSHANAQDNNLLDIRKTDTRASYPLITRDWAAQPVRRSSPPLCDLFPEYYEPIEPEQTTSYVESSGATNMSPELDHASPERDTTVAQSLLPVWYELQARRLYSQPRPVVSSDAFNGDHDAVQTRAPPIAAQLPPSVEPRVPGPSAPSKHHCLISGHVFEHHRLSRLPSDVEIHGLEPPSQHSAHKQEDLKVFCMICRARISEHLWKCIIPVCLREVCGDCKSRLDQERASDAKVGWAGGV